MSPFFDAGLLKVVMQAERRGRLPTRCGPWRLGKCSLFLTDVSLSEHWTFGGEADSRLGSCADRHYRLFHAAAVSVLVHDASIGSAARVAGVCDFGRVRRPVAHRLAPCTWTQTSPTTALSEQLCPDGVSPVWIGPDVGVRRRRMPLVANVRFAPLADGPLSTPSGLYRPKSAGYSLAEMTTSST